MYVWPKCPNPHLYHNLLNLSDVRRINSSARKQTLAEITNSVNEFLQQTISVTTVRRHLRREGFTRRKIRKQTVVSAVNKRQSVSWCRRRLTRILEVCHLLGQNTHGCRTVGGQGEHFPLLCEVEGTPCVLSPTFFGEEFFVLMHTVFIG